MRSLALHPFIGVRPEAQIKAHTNSTPTSVQKRGTQADVPLMAAMQELRVLPLPGCEDDPQAYSIQLQLRENEACPARVVSKTFAWDHKAELWSTSCSGIKFRADKVSAGAVRLREQD